MAWTQEYENQLRQQYKDHQTDLFNQLQTQLHRGNYAGANEIKSLMAELNPQVQKDFEANIAKLKAADIGSENLAVQQHIGNILSTDPAAQKMGQQALNEAVVNKNQLAKQDTQLQDLRTQYQNQQFGGALSTGGAGGMTLAQALQNQNGALGNLNQFLGQQESQTFNTQLKPLIQMALGSKGLSDSGAQVELQSKALAQLEQERQSNMMQAALGSLGQLQGLQRSDVMGNIGQTQANLNSGFDLQRSAITMQFQQQLEQQRNQLASELSQRQGGGSPDTMHQILGYGGMAASIGAAPFTGGMSLAAAPLFMNMAMNPNSYGGSMAGAQGLAQLGGNFFSQGTSVPQSRNYNSAPYTGMGSKYYGQYPY